MDAGSCSRLMNGFWIGTSHRQVLSHLRAAPPRTITAVVRASSDQCSCWQRAFTGLTHLCPFGRTLALEDRVLHGWKV